MVGIFVAFIRVVYGRMIYMSLPIYLIHFSKFNFVKQMHKILLVLFFFRI